MYEKKLKTAFEVWIFVLKKQEIKNGLIDRLNSMFNNLIIIKFVENRKEKAKTVSFQLQVNSLFEL